MAGLSIISPGPGQGKTAVAAGLLSLLGRAGVGRYLRVGEPSPHPDATFISSAFGLLATADEMTIGATAGARAAGTVALGPTIVEGDGPPPTDLPTVIVAPVVGDATVATVARLADQMRRPPIGVILSGAPGEQARYVEQRLRPALAAAGLRVLGVLPETRALRGHTVRELAAFLGADIRGALEGLENVVESYMIGAMSHLDSTSLSYFGRMTNKAVVTGGNRIDVHQGALGTDCQCLVLTGGYDPDPVVLRRAEAENVPLLKVLESTPETMERIGAFLETVRFRHASKIAVVADLMRQNIDLAPIESALAVSATARV